MSLPLAIWIETPITPPGRAAYTSRRLIGLAAVLAGVAEDRGAPCHQAYSSTVRKFMLGHGGLKKDVAKPLIMSAVKALGDEPANYDEADAAAGWHWAASLPAYQGANGSLWFLDVASQAGVAIGPLSGRPDLATVIFAQRGDEDEVAFGRAARWMRLALDAAVKVHVERANA